VVHYCILAQAQSLPRPDQHHFDQLFLRQFCVVFEDR
jgi:hypothetical protein